MSNSNRGVGRSARGKRTRGWPRPATRALGVSLLLWLTANVSTAEGQPYSPYVGPRHPNQVFWGDTHLHTSWSSDAGGTGNRILAPEQAYRFARGETVVGNSGEPVALRRPLDFLVVADHSEALGLFTLLQEKNPTLLATENGKRWAEMLEQGLWGEVALEAVRGLMMGRNPYGSESARAKIAPTMWERVIANADRFNDPGNFTAFIGYEWSSMPAGANLHRVVMFRDGSEKAGKVVPFSSLDSGDPADLWRYLADYENKTGGYAFAIPHNSNLSSGRMFELVDFEGKPFSNAYASERRRWEPLVEATQIKGDSEASPALSPDDEFADFGTWLGFNGPAGHEDWMFEGEYVRPALGNGLAIEESLGVNPFQFGLIGSTDSHTGLSTADDDDFWGKFASNEPPVRNLQARYSGFDVRPDSGSKPLAVRMGESAEITDASKTWSLVSSGYAAVWARRNTRDDIFDAMERRETYATTGPRMTVRFFGGWTFEASDAVAPNLARVGYAKGAPMGGTLTERSGNPAPSFLVSAARDPEGANLDRVQVVKLWIEDGDRRERIYDVAVSDGRKIEADGRCRTPVGDTVNVEEATYENSIGAGMLTTVWRDPDFDASQRAAWYVRVIEIPTPRWSTYDAVRLGAKLDANTPRTTQGRAYTSAIWYAPR